MADENRGKTGDIPRPYVYMLRFGPWAVSGFGTTLVLFGLLSQRPATVVSLLIVVGSACMVLGIVLPRTSGPVTLGRNGMEVAIQSLRDVDSGAFQPGTIAAVVTDVAEKTIPDTEPNKDRLVVRFGKAFMYDWRSILRVGAGRRR